MASIAQVTVRFGVDLKDFTTKMQKATKEIQALGRQMQSTGRNLTRNITLPIAGLGVAATKLAIDFDESMTKIQTLVGISANTVEDFKGKVLALSGQTAQAPAALADALFTVTSAGLRGAEALEVLKMAAKGSAVGMGDTKEIARSVTAVMQAYGPEVMSAAQAMDVLTATVREGNLEASELAPVLGRVVGLASQMGISFDEVGASIATFTRLGVDSAEAVTGLRGFLSGIIKPTKEGRDALAKMGLTFADLRNEIAQNGLAKTMFQLVQAFDGNIEALSAVIPNVRALGAVMGTAGAQGEQYLKIQDSIANSTGILNQAFEDTTKSGAFKLKEAFASLKQVGTDIGSIVLPVVADLAKNVKSLFERFAQLSQNTKENIVKFAAMAAAIGPVIYAVGTLITSFGGLLKTLRTLSLFIAANPWFALAGAVGAVVAALVGYSKISKAVEKGRLSEKVKKEKEEVNLLVSAITNANNTNESRKRLLDELQKKYPDFLGSLDKEKVTNEELAARLKDVNAEYERKIIQQVAEEKTTELLRKRIALQEKEAELVKQIAQEENKKTDSTALGGAAGLGGDNLTTITALNAQLEGVRSEQTQLNEEIATTQQMYAEMLPTVEGIKEVQEQKLEGGVEETQVVKEQTEAVKEQAMEYENMHQMREQALADLQKQKDWLSEQEALAMQEAAEGLEQYSDTLDEVKAKTGDVQEQTSGFGQMLTGVFSGLSNTISGVFESMLTGAEVSFKGIIKMLVRLIAKLAAAAIAAAVLAALLPGAGSAKLATGAKAALTFKDLFANFAGFRADGGPVSSGKSYIVGERGPELFTPNVSGGITPNHMLGGGAAGRMQIELVGSANLKMNADGSLAAMLRKDNIRLKKLGG